MITVYLSGKMSGLEESEYKENIDMEYALTACMEKN